jgi:hypothetical protein
MATNSPLVASQLDRRHLELDRVQLETRQLSHGAEGKRGLALDGTLFQIDGQFELDVFDVDWPITSGTQRFERWLGKRWCLRVQWHQAQRSNEQARQ